MTKQRNLILRIVRESCDHMTAEQISQIAKREMPSIVTATVYNNLNALTAEGKIARIRVANGPDHFDKTTYTHFHMVCDQCGKMTDLDEVVDPTPDIEKTYGIHVYAMELNAHYICNDCQKEITNESQSSS